MNSSPGYIGLDSVTSRCHFGKVQVSYWCCVIPGSPTQIFQTHLVLQMILGTYVQAPKSGLTFPVAVVISHDPVYI